MMKSDRFRSASKLVLGFGLVLCALACAVYGVLMIPAVMGLAFHWEYLALVGFVAVLFLLVSLILFCIAKGEAAEEVLSDPVVEAAAPASVEIRFTEPKKQAAPAHAISCIKVDTKTAPKKVTFQCDKALLKKVGMIAVPTIAVGLIAWSVSSNIENAKKAKRRRQIYRWLG